MSNLYVWLASFLMGAVSFWLGFRTGANYQARVAATHLQDILRLIKEGRDMVVSKMTELEQCEKEMNNGR